MAKELKKFQKGEDRTLVEAVEANKVIDAINAMNRIQVSPGAMGKVTQGDDATIIDLSPLDEYIKQLVQQAIAGNGKDPNDDGTTNNGGGPDIGGIINQLNSIINALRSASISLSCNADGTITGTINIPI